MVGPKRDTTKGLWNLGGILAGTEHAGFMKQAA